MWPSNGAAASTLHKIVFKGSTAHACPLIGIPNSWTYCLGPDVMGVWKTVAAFQWLGEASRAVGAAEIIDPGLEKHHLTAAFFPGGRSWQN